MRALFFLLLAAMLLLGLLFAALNDSAVHVDLYFAAVDASLGGALVAALLIGFLLAGLVLWLTVIWPQSMRLDRARRALAAPQSQRTGLVSGDQ